MMARTCRRATRKPGDSGQDRDRRLAGQLERKPGQLDGRRRQLGNNEKWSQPEATGAAQVCARNGFVSLPSSVSRCLLFELG